jgi:hypothetical protein
MTTRQSRADGRGAHHATTTTAQHHAAGASDRAPDLERLQINRRVIGNMP